MATLETNHFDYILNAYNLNSERIESFGKVKKVHTRQGIFALKGISANNNLQFVKTVEELYKSGYTRLVPIYRTKDGSYLVNRDHQYYYLMPWVEAKQRERDDKHHLLFRELARLHTVTLKDTRVEKEELKQHYDSVTTRWDQRLTFLETFIDTCERSIYMSPFELQFATYFHEITQACRFARSRLDEWYELVKESKRFRTALIHGKVSADHFLYDQKEHGYFSSLEKIKRAPAVNDLVSFYYQSLKTYPVQCDDCLDWLNTYRKHYSLKQEELQLFLSYLAFPEPIYRCVERYVSNKAGKSELQHVRKLQSAYWLNKNIEYFASKVIQEELAKKEQQQMERWEKEQENMDVDEENQ